MMVAAARPPQIGLPAAGEIFSSAGSARERQASSRTGSTGTGLGNRATARLKASAPGLHRKTRTRCCWRNRR